VSSVDPSHLSAASFPGHTFSSSITDRRDTLMAEEGT
jgi:hypothetical protein